MNRLKSIDALRGFVMVIMLIDHIRETFYLHLQVSDPVDVFVTNPDLFYTRFVSSICAPVFIWLTGVSAWLFMQKHSKIETSKFLLKRGIFLVLLEVTLITFLWSGKYPPDMFFLFVIWCIGVCMIALSGIIFLRSWQILLIGITIVCGHNLIGGFELNLDSIFYIAWAILYQREVFDLGGILFRTSYPILPWIGVIALGFISGPWFSNIIPTEQRQKMMLSYGFLGLFLFNLSMLSLGFLFLYLFEKLQNHKIVQIMSHFGAAPMFFYVLHLFVLQILYKIGYSMLGPNQGHYLSFPSVSYIWFTFIILTIALYFPTKWFAQYKQANKHIAWLKYF